LHRDIVTDMHLSKNGQTLYSVSQDSSLKIYSLVKKCQLRSIKLSDLALSSCSVGDKVVFAGSWDNNIYTYSVDYGRVLDVLPAHDDAVSSICLNGENLLSGSWDSTVKLWQIRPSGLHKVPLIDFIENQEEVKSVAIDAQNHIAVTGSEEGTIILFDLRSKKSIRTIQPHIDSVSQVSFSGDSRKVFSCSLDGHIKATEVSGAETLSVDTAEELNCFVCDDRTMLVGGHKGKVRAFDVMAGEEKTGKIFTKQHQDPIYSIASAAHGVVTGSKDRIHHWKFE